MTERGESLDQRRDNALGPAIPPYRQRMVGQERDVQG